jgi:hypothetical protein
MSRIYQIPYGMAAGAPLPGPRPSASAILPDVAPVLDEFGRRSGPDVVVGFDLPVRVYAIFAVDEETGRLRVNVVDDRGRLVRILPPESVGQMLAAMAAYGRVAS